MPEQAPVAGVEGEQPGELRRPGRDDEDLAVRDQGIAGVLELGLPAPPQGQLRATDRQRPGVPRVLLDRPRVVERTEPLRARPGRDRREHAQRGR